MRRFGTIMFALFLAGCGRGEALSGPANDIAANGAANAAGEENAAEPPPGDNGFSTVPPGNACGSRTVTVPCQGAPTRTCWHVVPGPPCPGR